MAIGRSIDDQQTHVEVIRPGDRAGIEALVRFIERVTDQTGARPLSDHLWLDLRQGGGDGFVAVRLSDDDSTVGVAQVSMGNEASSLETVLAPARADDANLHAQLAHQAVQAFQAIGGGRLYWWLDNPPSELRQLAARCGLRPVRQLREMRATLPHPKSATISTRSFVPGTDDEAWLRFNNAAFADHGEQGGWTREMLSLRMDEPWFDPNGFRLFERDGELLGFCWTKQHPDADPPAGEIYVIAVHPDAHGQGLGRELTLAGLDAIAERGVGTALLYVDDDNTAATTLYEQLGFTTHRIRTAFAGHLSAL